MDRIATRGRPGERTKQENEDLARAMGCVAGDQKRAEATTAPILKPRKEFLTVLDDGGARGCCFYQSVRGCRTDLKQPTDR